VDLPSVIELHGLRISKESKPTSTNFPACGTSRHLWFDVWTARPGRLGEIKNLPASQRAPKTGALFNLKAHDEWSQEADRVAIFRRVVSRTRITIPPYCVGNSSECRENFVSGSAVESEVLVCKIIGATEQQACCGKWLGMLSLVIS
jgi:hypothetical protein